MGAAPSSEILTTAPFRPARLGSGRVLTLIPSTEEFFPSPNSSLFEQFYEARTDPYVRYYIRGCKQSDQRLDCIPPVTFTIDELYERHVTRPGQGIYRAGNEELRADYMNGRQDRIRPIPCAVAFQYDDQDSSPEGCVSLRNSFVRVIGGVGCFPNENVDDESMDIEIFLRKSAGDHNMARVMLFAAWLFHEHCTVECGLPQVPMPVLTFHGLKTNIPFFCFLRELRDCVELLQGNKEEHKLWLDGAFIRCHISASHAADLCVALANRYRVLLVPKTRNKLGSPIPPSPIPDSPSLQHMGTELSMDGDDYLVASRMSNASRFQKQFYTLCGFIESPEETIPARASCPNGVYIVCVDSVLLITPDSSDSMVEVSGDDMSSLNIQKILKVRRGDILRFVPEKQTFTDTSAKTDFCSPIPEPLYPAGKADVVEAEVRQHALSFASDTLNGSTENFTPLKGTWLVDTNIHLENVLLALVHDECKSAREAPSDDPHWMRHPETNELVYDGNFYIWKFTRGNRQYFYGTVPKFANTYKKRRDVPKRRNGVLPSPVDGAFDPSRNLFRDGGLTDICHSLESSVNPQVGRPFITNPMLQTPHSFLIGTPPPGVMPVQHYGDGGQVIFLPTNSPLQTTAAPIGSDKGGFSLFPQAANPFVQVPPASLPHMHHMAHGQPMHLMPQIQPMQTMPLMQTASPPASMCVYMGHPGMPQHGMQTAQLGTMMPFYSIQTQSPPPIPSPANPSSGLMAPNTSGYTVSSHVPPAGVGSCDASAKEWQLPIINPTDGAQGGNGAFAFGQNASLYPFFPS